MIKSSGEQSAANVNSISAADSWAEWFQVLVDGWKDPIACGVLGLLMVLLLIVSWGTEPTSRPTPHLSIKPESVQRGHRG